MSELPVPPDAGESSAIEVLRAWLSAESLHCSLRADVFEDPSAWGTVLADVARHVALALQETEGIDPSGTLRTIGEAFASELSNPASEGTPPAPGTEEA
jgi:hypothetical protein